MSASPVLACGVVVMSHIELINAITSRWVTKDMQSFLVIEFNLNALVSSGKSSLLSGVIDSALKCGCLLLHTFEVSIQHYLRLYMKYPEAVP